MKKERPIVHHESSTAFNHAWQNEMNRCLSQSMVGFVEFGNEFDFVMNEQYESMSPSNKKKK